MTTSLTSKNVLPPRHSYWMLYRIGLETDSSWWGVYNLFAKYPFIYLLIIVATALGHLSLYFFKNINSLKDHAVWYQVFILVGIIWSHHLHTLFDYLARDRVNDVNRDIMNNILKYVNNLTRNPMNKYKVHLDIPMDERYTDEHGLSWRYDGALNEITNIITRIIKTVVILGYLCWQHMIIVPILTISYLLIFYLLVPFLSKLDKERRKGYSFGKRVEHEYGVYMLEWMHDTNPALDNMAHSYVQTNIKNNFDYKVWARKWHNKSIWISNCQDIIVFMIAMCMIYFEDYSNILMLIMNQGSLFAVVNIYISLTNREVNNKRSMSKLFKLLDRCIGYTKEQLKEEDDKLDELDKDSKKKDGEKDKDKDKENDTDSDEDNDIGFDRQLYQKKAKLNVHITKVTIHELKYKFQKDHNDGKIKNLKDAFVHLPHLEFSTERGVILLDGSKGCGKTIIAHLLAGMYDGRLCEYVKAHYSNGVNRVLPEELRSLHPHRMYIHQDCSADMHISGRIPLTAGQLFPNLSIDGVRDLLKRSVNLANKTPRTISHRFPEKMSGGEKQSVAVVSSLYKAMESGVSFIIGDELDKALDSDSAIKLTDWLIDTFDGLVILITHHDTVKEHLKKRGLLRQRLTFDGEFDTKVIVERF